MENPITCARCQKELSPDEFNRISGTSGAKRKFCRACNRVNDRKTRSSGYQSYLKNLVRNSRYDSKQRGITDYTITAELLHDLWVEQAGRCAISGVVLTHHLDGSGRKDFNASIDRIDSQMGYVPGNVQLVAGRVNLMRGNLGVDMLYWWVKTIYQHSCD
jgi:hypothetical protein